MKKLIILLYLYIPVLATAQTTGVRFEQNLSWEQILAKARTEHKYIFLDCFATWCGPCRQMDAKVYPTDSVSQALNPRFISVKVQFDTTRNDDQMTRAWYADAHRILESYKVNAFPTFLFFNDQGEIIHRGVGYLKPQEFIKLAGDAADPEKQYYTLVRDYRSGKTSYAQLPALAVLSRKFNENPTAFAIAEDYEHHYLDKLPDSQFATKDNMEFLSKFAEVLSSGDRIFTWYRDHGNEVDTLLHTKGYSNSMVNYIIYKEQVLPEFAAAKARKSDPDWTRVHTAIQQIFGAHLADVNVLNARVNWFKEQKNWKNYTHYLVEQLERDHIEDSPKDLWGVMGLNNNAWDIFQHSTDKQELETALKWADLAIAIQPKDGGNKDTKANILYKLGRKKEALALEAQALELEPKNKDIQEAYKKMQQGLTTW
ncbi:thioredoxin fold domain-containing protein [Mucilaginibacter sp. AW1-3]